MNRILLSASIVFLLSACGSEDTVTSPTNNASSAALDIGAANTSSVDNPVSADSQSLLVSEQFSFETSRAIDVDFDLEQARGHSAKVSICTEFDPDGGVFDVNYDSCTVQGRLNNGIFSHSMEVTNNIESVAGVVWFDDASMQPLMQIFSIDHSAESDKSRTTMSASISPRIVWR